MAVDDIEAIYPLLSARAAVSQSENHRMIPEWNDARTVYAEVSTIERLFEAQVDRYEDVAAVGFQAQRSRLTVN